jgi:hypothetical protein
MRVSTLVIAGALALGTAGASASPLIAGANGVAAPESLATTIHHKPGHRGGPPWMRGGRDRDDRRESRRRRDWDDGYQSRTVCRTTYRTAFDPYQGAYVRRPVRICG